MKELRDACREAACRAQDDKAWARRLHESRSVHTRTGLDGMYEATVRLCPDDGARFDSALQSKTDEFFQAARAAGRKESRAAYMADALVAFIESGSEYGNGRSSTPFTTLKIAVVAAIPRPSTATAKIVKDGRLTSVRPA